jgi:E-phenylitaconyl-CoA hydratase
MRSTTPAVSDGLVYEQRGAVAVVTLDRAERGNAITPTMRASLGAIWEHVRDEASIRAAVFSAAGDRHFCTGADLDVVAGHGGNRSESGSVRREVRFTARQVEVWKPVICAVNGLVAGAGLHFVVDADVVVAVESAAFVDTHVNVGAVGALENIGLAKRLPLGTVLRMTLMGKSYRLPAQRAYELGLVDEIVPTGQALAVALEMADVMAANSPSAMAASQQAIWRSLETSYGAALEHGFALIRNQWHHPDYAEGARAFVEHRAPVLQDGTGFPDA